MKITEHEKKQLKSKISISISSYIQRKRYLKYGLGLAAACIIGFFSLITFNTKTEEPSALDSYVKSLENKDVPEQIKLILNDDQKVNIAESEASISYSTSGDKVTIGSSKFINQNTSKSPKAVFNTLIVPYGKRSSIELADGSKVWLNSGSKLVFPAAFNQEKREVYLEGEAIFEVAHDKKHPFIVKSNEQEIEVLGTIFNVSNYHDDDLLSTVLKSGSVKVTYSKNSITIVPGTLAAYDRGTKRVNTQKVDVESYFSWRDGIFIFKNDSMESIMKKISRYYNIDIIINNKELANTTFSGYLDVKDTVESVLKTIRETTKFEYNITNNKLFIN
ncbi:MAG: FecR domain-containing protein [Gelidibacter sp.]|nr:FecR domain-containing protein [Gelidibacter sp.]